MSLNLALNNALSGLRVNQQAMDILSNNLSNANTDGYSRQIIQQSAITVAGVGSGVKIDDVVRKVSNYLIRAVQTQSSQMQSSSTINDYQGRVQTLLGSPGAANSLDTYMSSFVNALQQLSDAPDSTANRSNLVNSATTLATTISNLAGSIEDLRFQADQDIQTAVTAINQQMTQLNTINRAISSAAVSGQSTASLLDQRDAALRVISQQMSISTAYDQNGVVTVTTGNGIALVDSLSHQLSYRTASSAGVFANDQPLDALRLLTLDSLGNQAAPPQDIISAGTSDTVNSLLSGGTIAGLQQVRDSILPGMLSELDMLSSSLRDTVNAISNAGTAFPPPNSLTGTRLVSASDAFNWSGSVRIAALQADGTPVPAPYADQLGGLPPLTIDLASLDSGDGKGKPTVQAIIDEINSYYSPQPKVELGNLNNIQLASDTNTLPSGNPSLFTFDFDLQNLSGGNAQFFVTNLSVKNDVGADITSVTQAMPTLALSPSNTYQTTQNSGLVTITTAGLPSDIKVGDTIYLSAPGTATVNGINAANLTGYVTVTDVNGKEITFDSGMDATSTGPVNDASGVTLQPPTNVAAGTSQRSGQMQVDLTTGVNSSFYDITATVAVVQPDGTIKNSQITYHVKNSQQALMNQRYSATAATADGTRVVPSTTQNALKAILVDADGHELPKDANGQYGAGATGYLEVVSSNSNYGVAIDSLDSVQLGQPEGNPPKAGTNRGFSHYFEMNNFFESNASTSTGDTVKNSAINFKVEDRIAQDPNLIPSGNLTLSNQPADSTQPPLYTYQLYAGDNSNAARLAGIATQMVTFDAAGSLPQTTVNLTSYTSSFLAELASSAAGAKSSYTSANTLYTGLKSQADAVSGVNIDEELANTVTYQNAYSATARIVTIVNQMYQELFNMLG